MIKCNYDTWKQTCDMLKDYSNKYGKFYLQLYPLWNKVDLFSSEDFYEKYIQSGLVFLNEKNYMKLKYNCIKKDGSYRNRFLINPLMYIYYINIGTYLSNKHRPRNNNIVTMYGGDYSNKDLHYKNSWNNFNRFIESESKNYAFYFKTDIKDFYNKLNIQLLMNLLTKKIKVKEKDKYIIENILKWCGGDLFPQIECGTTSSFLATKIYLEDSDALLYKELKKNTNITRFKMCRYVDDLYIFMDLSDSNKIKNMENWLINTYENILIDYNLSLNKDKTKLKSSIEIYDDLFSSSQDLDCDINNEDATAIDKICISSFIDSICDKVELDGLNYSDYLDLIRSNLGNENLYYANRIFDTMVYKKMDWISDSKFQSKMNRLLDNNYEVLAFDPRRWVSLIVRSKNNSVIKKFLNILYTKSEKFEWRYNYTILGLYYLLNTNFYNNKLINKIMECDETCANFINYFYKDNLYNNVIDEFVIKVSNDERSTNTNIGLYKLFEQTSVSNQNYVQAQVYNKCFIDGFTSILENKNNTHYRKDQFKEVYKNLQVDNSIYTKLSTICDDRNLNPLCHYVLNDGNFKKSSTFNRNISNYNNLIRAIYDTL